MASLLHYPRRSLKKWLRVFHSLVFKRGALRRVWRRGFLLGAAAVLTVSLTGCDFENYRTEAAQIPQLVLASPSDPSTFNPPLNTSLFSTYVFALINRGMLTTNGVTGDLEPELAESWEISEDGLQIVFTLREGLKWSDGEPLTADDVVFTYRDIYLNEAVPTGVRDLLRIGASRSFPEVSALDARRIEFRISEPFAPFLRYSGGIALLPKHILEAGVKETDANGDLRLLSMWGLDTDPKDIVSSGPYRLVDFVPGERLLFERNPYYWRQDDQGNPQPYIERIVYQIAADQNQIISFRSMGLDYLEVVPESFELLKREEERGKFTIYNGGPAPESRSISFNLNKASSADGTPLVDPIKSRWFNTLAFRQAVAYGINRARIRDNIYRGLGEIQHSPIFMQSPFYLSPEAGLKTYSYDPDQARALLTEAGFTYNAQGELLDWDGNPVHFTLLVKSEEKSRVDMSAQVAQDLADLGMEVDLQVLSFNTVLRRLMSRNWDCYVGGFRGGNLEPHSSFNVWYSGGRSHQFNQGPIPGEDNPIQGWEVSDWEREIDALFAAGSQELDEEKRKVIYGQFQQIVQEQVPFIYLVNALSLEAVRNRIDNINFTALGGALWNLYELSIIDEIQ